MKRFNNTRLSALAISILFLFSAGCEKAPDYNEVISTDQTKPDVVTGIQVDNVQGGAYITYSLPKTDNLLYILAEYKINDEVSRQKKASYYTDTIFVDGFAKSKEYEVTLHAISRANVKSDPVVVKVHPDTPSYLAAFPSLNVQADFGGIHVSTVNKESKPIGVVVLTKNEDNELLPIEQFYTDDSTVALSIRGYDVSPREFGIYVTDPWGNRSDTLFTTLK